MAKSAAQMIKDLERVRGKIPNKVEDLILLSKEVKEAKINELESGLLPDGTKIGRYRNQDYARKKNILNPKAGLGNVDSIYTGLFSNTLFPYNKKENYYLFGFQTSYGNKLVRDYGLALLGLNKVTFLDIQKKYILPDVIKFIKKEIGK